MTKPKGAHLNSSHFQFLSGKGGKGNVSITVDEVKRYLAISKQMEHCVNWTKKVDLLAMQKVAKIMEKALNDAEYPCGELPFTIPDNLKLDGGDWKDTNFQAPNMFN